MAGQGIAAIHSSDGIVDLNSWEYVTFQTFLPHPALFQPAPLNVAIPIHKILPMPKSRKPNIDSPRNSRSRMPEIIMSESGINEGGGDHRTV